MDLWNGQQLFTKEWVKYATTPTPTSKGEYGAQIWLNAGKVIQMSQKHVFF